MPIITFLGDEPCARFNSPLRIGSVRDATAEMGVTRLIIIETAVQQRGEREREGSQLERAHARARPRPRMIDCAQMAPGSD